MKNLIATAVLLLVVPLVNCPWACAQKIPMGFDVFGEFGPSCLEGNVHSSATGKAKCETGRVFAGGRLRLTRHDALEVSYSYSPNVFNEAYPVFYLNTRTRSDSFNYVRYLSTNPYLQPFATVGVGWERYQGFGISSAGNVVSGDSAFAWNFGAGTDLILQRHIALRFEFRDYTSSMPVFHTSSLHNIVPSIGIVFRFNRTRKL